MENNIKINPTVDFLVRLRKIDKAQYTVRDILILYTVISCPGIMGQEISEKLALPNRSSIHSGVQRLIRNGMIEDRRAYAARANPSILHALPKGIALWEEIKP